MRGIIILFSSLHPDLHHDENLNKWHTIVIHHAAAEVANAARIDEWHKQNGWEGVGYHFVIGNGSLSKDGEIEATFRWRLQKQGAHVKGKNSGTIGICLVGNFSNNPPSVKQLISLKKLVQSLSRYCNISQNNIVKHCDIGCTECPGKLFPWNKFIESVKINK